MTSKRDRLREVSRRHAAAGIDAPRLDFDSKSGDWMTSSSTAALWTGREVQIDLGRLMHGHRSFPGKHARNRQPRWAIVLACDNDMPERAPLGDTDRTKWLVSEKTGEPRDPWQEVLSQPVIVPGEDEVYLWTTESKPGKAAIATLLDAWDARTNPEPIDALPDAGAPVTNGHDRESEIPRVRLGSRAIHFEDKTVYVPTLTILGWEPRPLTARLLNPPPYPKPVEPDPQRDLFKGTREGDDIPF
jgi:hypothetical protein